MATIEALPPESLDRILELADEPERWDWDLANFHPSAFRQRAARLGLKAASLVARSWKEPAQAVLWRSVGILCPGDTKRMTASAACGRCRAVRAQLRVDALKQDGEPIGGVLERLNGVQSLDIDFDFYLRNRPSDDVAWLAHPSLRGVFLLSRSLTMPELILLFAPDLTTLIMNAKFTEAIPANRQPSFHLRKLTLGPYATSATLNHTLLASSASSLVSLTLENPIPCLGPVLSSFTALSNITLCNNKERDISLYDALLAALVSPVESLTVIVRRWFDVTGREFMEPLAEAMRGKAWRSLKEVSLPCSQAELKNIRAGEAVSELCATRGIVVRFA